MSSRPGVARVVAVVVTWNRRDLLQESIAAVRAQAHAPTAIVVVDNASDDGTAALLAGPFGEGLHVVTLPANTGGAGGFAAGMAVALTYDPDLVWLLDDDTVPTESALAELVRAWSTYPGDRPAVLASRVVWTDGRDHPMNTPRVKPGATRALKARAAAVGALPIRSASFVSIACDAQALRELGLPIAEYFLWNDDFEHSARLLRHHPGLYVTGSVVVHKTKKFGSTDTDPGERFYYEVRNKIWLFRRSRALARRELPLYLGAAGRRWLRTYRRSPDRATIARTFKAGVRDGMRSVPHTNADFLQGIGAGDEVVCALRTQERSAMPREVDGTAPVPAFSVLLPIYDGDLPDQLKDSLRSVTTEQQLRPAEVVVVQDGPISAALTDALLEQAAVSEVPVRIIELAENIGLGPALAEGLQACTHDVVARQDADDVSLPERFARQLPLIAAGYDVVGSGLIEFDGEADATGLERPVPVTAADIERGSRLAQPVFHPTVVYRRTAVQAAGGYQDMPLLEDYWLFGRMIHRGAQVTNVVEPLVKYRISGGAYARRGGLEMCRSELRLQWRFRRIGFTNNRQFLRNCVVRGIYRLVPEQVRRTAYRRILLAGRRG